MTTPSMEDYIEQIYMLIEEKDMHGFPISRKHWQSIPPL